jgi:hypothetical protein
VTALVLSIASCGPGIAHNERRLEDVHADARKFWLMAKSSVFLVASCCGCPMSLLLSRGLDLRAPRDFGRRHCQPGSVQRATASFEKHFGWPDGRRLSPQRPSCVIRPTT